MIMFFYISDTAAVLLAEVVLNSLWQSMALVAVVWALLQVIRRMNATTRYTIWLASLVAVVVLPILTVVMRPWQPAGGTPSAASEIVNTSSSTSAAIDQSVPRAGETTLTNENSAAPANESIHPAIAEKESDAATSAGLHLQFRSNRWWTIFLIGWLVIAGGLTARLAWSYRYLQNLKRKSSPISGEDQRRFEWLLNSQSIRRSIRLHSSPQVLMPMAVGLSRPVIVIPKDLSRYLTEKEFDQVLLHELAHMKRWDDWTNLFQKLAESIFFFFPAVLWIGRRLNLEREIACDEWVISKTGESRPYAICLTKLAELTIKSGRPSLAPAMAVGKKQISRRIRVLLNYEKYPLPCFSSARLVVSLAVLLVALVQCSRMSSVIAVTMATEPDEVAKAIDAKDEVDIATEKAAWAQPSTSLSLSNVGPNSRVASRPPKSSSPTQNAGNAVAAIRLAASIPSESEKAAALVAIAEKLSGDEVPFSFFEAVVSIKSSAERARVLSTLLEKRLSSETLNQLLKATASIDSNDAKATLLVKAAARSTRDQRVFSTFLQVVKTLSSSWEQERAMMALLKQGNLSSAMREQLADVARTNVSSSQSRNSILATMNNHSLD